MRKITRIERDGLDLEKIRLLNGIEKVLVRNHPGGLTYFVHPQHKFRQYLPEIVPETIGRALNKKFVKGDDSRYLRMCPGEENPDEIRSLEPEVHTIVGASALVKEFCGIDEENANKFSQILNYFLGDRKFRSCADPVKLMKAAEQGYLKPIKIDKKTIYFPTEQAVRSFCPIGMEKTLSLFAIHTGVNIGTGHKDFSMYGD